MQMPDDRLSEDTLDYLIDKAASDGTITVGLGTNEAIDDVLMAIADVGVATPALRKKAHMERIALDAKLDAQLPE